MFTLRNYQEEAVQAAVDFLKNSTKNGIMIEPTGSGKSLMIAETIGRLGEPTLVFQPSQEILKQNYNKYTAYGYEAGIYSASFGKKEIDKSPVVFAMIGSVKGKAEYFKHFKYIFVDECHGVNAKGGMYEKFLGELNRQILGWTASPYRMAINSMGCQYRFLTRTSPKIFSEVVHVTQNKFLFDSGYLAKLVYYDIAGFDRSKLRENSTGSDFSDQSVMNYYEQIGFSDRLITVVKRLKQVRKSILIFTKFIRESEELMRAFPDMKIVTGDTKKSFRWDIVEDFAKQGFQCLTNSGTMTTGVDFPKLDCVLLARPMKSISLYYQMIGRGMRIHPDKEDCWIVDMCDNVSQFGRVEDFEIGQFDKGKWQLVGKPNGVIKPLTNVPQVYTGNYWKR